MDLYLEIFSNILLAIITISFALKPNFLNLQNKCFYSILIVSVVTGLANVLNAFFIDWMDDIGEIPVMITSHVYFLLHIVLSALFLQYVIIVTEKGKTGIIQKRNRFLWFIPCILCAILILLSPLFGGFFFTISVGTGYELTQWIRIIYCVSFFYTAVCAIYTIRYNEYLTFATRVSLSTYIILFCSIIGYSFLFPTPILLTGTATAIGLLLLFFSLQNPDQFIDSDMQIFNHKAFYEMVQSKLNDKNPICVIVVALDNFNLSSKTFGVTNAIKMLESLSKYMKLVTSNAAIYRYSNDSFSVILPESDQNMNVVNEIHERFEDIWKINNIVCKLSATIAVVNCPEFSSNIHDLTNMIDYILFDEKHNQNGTVIVCNEDIKERMKRNRKIEIALTHAIENDTFTIFYQPVYNNMTNRFDGAEALVRLYDEELGYIPPDEFIMIAEHNGTVSQIGKIVLEKVFHFVHKVKPEKYGFTSISVNLSVVQCMQIEYIDFLEEMLDNYQIPKHQIHFEITETMASTSLDFFSKFLTEMNKHGFIIVLDDYGSGFSTLSYIIELPFNIIKVDKGVLWGLSTNPRCRNILDYTINMLKSIDVVIIAEGAETEQHVQLLQSLGCHYIQGYYYSPPLDGDAFIEFMEEHKA